MNDEVIPSSLPPFTKVVNIEVPLNKEKAKIAYATLFKAFYEDGNISQNEKNLLKDKQTELGLTDLEIKEIEAEFSKKTQTTAIVDNSFPTVEKPKTKPISIFEKNKKVIFSALAIVLFLVLVFVFKDKIGGGNSQADTSQVVQKDSDSSKVDTVKSKATQQPTTNNEQLTINQVNEKRKIDSLAQIAKAKQATTTNNEPQTTNNQKKDLPPFEEPEMVEVQGGSFDMGCTSEQQDCGDDEKPLHSVKVSSFYMGKYEVSQKEWKAVMGKNPSNFKGDNLPVESVSWNDIQGFLRKLNELTGKKYRLPTEAEWEFAARDRGKQVLFGNGSNTADPSQMNFDASASYKKSYSVAGTYRAKTVPVNSFSPNSLGLYNLSGNVWEWCEDWYSADYYKNSPQNNPKNTTTGTDRVLRGGSWSNDPQYLRVADRNNNPPDDGGSYLGFRLCRTN